MTSDAALSRPSFARGLLLRFAIVYWALFWLPMFDDEILGFEYVGRAWNAIWAPLVRWVGAHVLGLSSELSSAVNGSGDKTFDYVSLLCIAWIAAMLASLWSLLDARRAHDARLRAILRVFIRYTLAFTILSYGIIKLFGGQFWPPSAGRLVQRYGDSSPMGLLWTFMGSSPAYVFFSGLAETVGGALLLFRRTTTLGALILTAVLTNIVLLNFCYDVCVKINSVHYLVMCAFLLLPDLRRLADVLVLQRPTTPPPTAPPPARRWVRIARPIVKYGVIALVVGTITWNARREARPRGSTTTWYSGYWDVTTFERDGHDVPAIITDTTRWRRIKWEVDDDKIYVRWRFMDDSYGDLYDVALDEPAHTMTLTPDPDDSPKDHPTGPIVLAYTRADAAHVELAGKVGAQAIAVRLQRFDPEQMLLVTRGFHWINDRPFNR
jgi:uncharacterized membrane protein YphA (DoxX/SURF4 family)